MEPREVSFDIMILALVSSGTTPGSPPINVPSDSTSIFGEAIFGDMIFGDDSTSIGTGVIGEEDISVPYSSNLELLQARINALTRALSPLDGNGILYYEREDGTIYRLNCSGNGAPRLDDSDKGRSDVHQYATINLIAHDPFWYSGSPHIESFSITGTSFFPFKIPWSIHRGSSNRRTLFNDGDVDAPLTIAIWGPITDPVFTNDTTGKAITLDLELVAGDRFDITTGKNRITAFYTPVGTGIPVNGQGYITVGSKFWLLRKGANTVDFSCDASTAGSGAHIVWSDQYAGVF